MSRFFPGGIHASCLGLLHVLDLPAGMYSQPGAGEDDEVGLHHMFRRMRPRRQVQENWRYAGQELNP